MIEADFRLKQSSEADNDEEQNGSSFLDLSWQGACSQPQNCKTRASLCSVGRIEKCLNCRVRSHAGKPRTWPCSLSPQLSQSIQPQWCPCISQSQQGGQPGNLYPHFHLVHQRVHSPQHVRLDRSITVSLAVQLSRKHKLRSRKEAREAPETIKEIIIENRCCGSGSCRIGIILPDQALRAGRANPDPILYLLINVHTDRILGAEKKRLPVRNDTIYNHSLGEGCGSEFRQQTRCKYPFEDPCPVAHMNTNLQTCFHGPNSIGIRSGSETILKKMWNSKWLSVHIDWQFLKKDFTVMLHLFCLFCVN